MVESIKKKHIFNFFCIFKKSKKHKLTNLNRKQISDCLEFGGVAEAVGESDYNGAQENLGE